MTNRKDRSPFVGSIQKLHLTVVDSIGEEPLTVRLGDLA
jgi:hypothetical protein